MNSGKQLLTMLSILALSASGSAVSALGASQQCTSEECACERALEQNTVEALEEFLKKYPHSTAAGESACAALAVPPEEEGAAGQSIDDAKTSSQHDATQYGG